MVMVALPLARSGIGMQEVAQLSSSPVTDDLKVHYTQEKRTGLETHGQSHPKSAMKGTSGPTNW